MLFQYYQVKITQEKISIKQSPAGQQALAGEKGGI